MDIRENFKGFVFFWKGMKAAKNDLWVSVQVLVALTIVLSIVLFVVEHAAQPDAYSNLWDSMVWGFMSYLGNPGQFSPGEPITIVGRFIAIIISVIKILIFAVPAGLVANGFRDAMAQEKQAKINAENAKKILQSMHCHCSLYNNIRYWPTKLYRFSAIKTNIDLSEEDIISAVKSVPYLCLRDLGIFVTGTHGVKPEMMAVEMRYLNRSYGFCSSYQSEDFEIPDSNVTIVCPVANTEAGLGYFAYHIARTGGFNVVISELLSSNADSSDNRCIVAGVHDYQYNDPENYPKLHEFVDDIKRNVQRSDNWVIVLNSASSPKEEKKHQKIRLYVNVKEEADNNSLDDCVSVNDIIGLKEFYEDLCVTMSKEHDIEPTVLYKKCISTRIQNYIRTKFGDVVPNVIEIGLADDYRVFGADVKKQWTSIKTIAEVIHRHFDKGNSLHDLEKWTSDDVKRHRPKLIPYHKGEK